MISTGKELRQAYLDFFRTLPDFPHPVVPSSPIVPPDDPTLLFTSAGMVQFKALYSGEVDPLPYPRAATVQKCLRAGGKGSDLENVGKTLRHHTFFEMLGNFSFGDYFKREAIRFAWEFCTSPKWMNLPKERMFPTIYGPTPAERDFEAIQYYAEETDCPNPLIPLDAKENFWGPAGDTGACGPCSEIKFFMGTDEELAAVREELRTGGEEALARIGKRVVDEGDLFLEIWNMVFPQFDQQRDGSRPLLKNKGIDTGAGLERMTVALRRMATGQLSTPYETDLMWPITAAVTRAVGNPIPEYHPTGYVTLGDRSVIERLVGDFVQYAESSDPGFVKAADAVLMGWRDPRAYTESFIANLTTRVSELTNSRDTHGKANLIATVSRIVVAQRLAINAIADHTRTLVFCLAEGLTPGNVGRRYVVRRIQRRALRFSSILGVDRPFMADVYDAVVEAMGEAYPEIKKNPDFIKKALRTEEETFLRTRDRGMKLLTEQIAEARERGDNRIPGEEAFRLWDTFGFPVDLTVEMAEEEGITVDMDGYTAAMKRQKDEAKKSWKGAKLDVEGELLDELAELYGTTEFLGYDSTGPVATELLAFIHRGSIGNALKEGEEGIVVLGSTPFYAESGGQVGDSGTIEHGTARFQVEDTQKTPHGIIIHRGKMVSGEITAGTHVTATVDADRREAIRRNHSSVHLLQAVLKKLVGEHITQAGSFVGPGYSRFDFTHSESIPREVLAKVQREVNRLVLEDTPVTTEVLPIEEAKQKGAIAVFGEKYGHIVRVVSMGGGQSVEFCGGTHVASTGQIAHYRIVAEGSVASGVRRIEAITGERALETELEEQYDVVGPVQSMLGAKGREVLTRIETLQARVKDLEKELAKYKRDAALRDIDSQVKNAIDLDGRGNLVVVRMDGVDANDLRTVAATLRDKLGDRGVAAVLSQTEDGKVAIVAAVGKEAQKDFPAGKVVNALAAPLGGKGGGKPDMAQAGAKDPGKLDEVIAGAAGIVLRG